MDHRACDRGGVLIVLGLGLLCLILAQAVWLQAAEIEDSGEYVAANGTVFTYTKTFVDENDETKLALGSVAYTWDEVQQYEQSNPRPVVDLALAYQAASLPPGELMSLVVWLRSSPGPDIARDLQQSLLPAIEASAELARDVARKQLPTLSLSPDEEDHVRQTGDGIVTLSTDDLSYIESTAITVEKDLDAVDLQIHNDIEAAVSPLLDDLQLAIEGLGGIVLDRIPQQSALVISLPAGKLPVLEIDSRVARIIADPKGELELDNQRSSLGLPWGFWARGIDGGIWDAGVLDTGVQQDHPAFAGINFISNMGVNDGHGHGTRVAGIIGSADATYTGMAYGLHSMLVGSCLDDVMGHAAWMVNRRHDDPEAVNLSCGYGRANDEDYSAFDQFFDGFIDDNRLLVGKSTGNGGVGVTTITHPAPAYNLLAVANVFDQNTVDRNDDVIRASSSRGPTLAGRKKPDIAAPGHETMSTSAFWAAGPDFTNIGGTSAAAPHVTGGVVLLTDLRMSDNPMASKAVLINTADAWTDNGTQADTGDDQRVPGSEWNATYGWGYLDLWEAWFNGLDVFLDAVGDGFDPAGQDFKLYRGWMWRNEKATLVWNRHVGFNGANFPVAVEALTDLDLWAYRAADGARLDFSFSGRDNVEQIAVDESTQVVLRVDVWGRIDPDVRFESFALSTEEHFERVNPPGFALWGAPGAFQGGAWSQLTVTVNNYGQVSSFNNRVTLTLPEGFNIVGGANPQDIGTIAGGANGTAQWTITCAQGSAGRATFSNTSYSYNERFTGSGSLDLICW